MQHEKRRQFVARTRPNVLKMPLRLTVEEMRPAAEIIKVAFTNIYDDDISRQGWHGPDGLA
jgi:hypothetical protein